jgi:hypothetical protein
MPLHTIDPPMAAYEAVQSTMADLVAQNGFRTPALRRADPAALALSSPHRTAVLGLDRIQGAKDLRSAAQITGWRFLVHHETTVVAAIDAVQTEKNQYRLGHVNEGPFVAGTEAAIRRVETLDQIRDGRFAPIFLLVPAIYVAALWLEDQTASADLVMVIPPNPKELTPFSPLPVKQFLESLTPLAARVPPEDRKAKRPSGG